MKVSTHSRDFLILDEIPWISGMLITLVTLFLIWFGISELRDGDTFAYFLLGFGLLAGPLFFALFVQRYQVIFSRPDGRITRRKRSILGYGERHFPLADVIHAEVQERRDRDRASMFRPVLASQTGRFPLVDYFVAGGGPERIADAVNIWLDGAELGRR